MTTGRQDVVEFLRSFKSAIELGYLSVKDEREKNRQSLIDLDITPADRRNILLSLTPEDYMAGPKADDTDDTKEIWEFGKEVGGKEVSIKLRLAQDPRKRTVHHAVVWSFHEAEFKTRYPLKKGGPR